MVAVRGGDYAAPSGLDTNQALRHIRKPCCDPASRDLLAQNNRPIFTQTDQMQRVLACAIPMVRATTATVFRDMAMCSSCF
jgi:hypothetical protein